MTDFLSRTARGENGSLGDSCSEAYGLSQRLKDRLPGLQELPPSEPGNELQGKVTCKELARQPGGKRNALFRQMETGGHRGSEMPVRVPWARRLLLALVLLCSSAALHAAGSTNFPARIAALIAPEKLATLKPGGANPRIQKAVAQLEAARLAGEPVQGTAERAVVLAGYTNREAAALTAQALIRNHDIAMKLGCLTPQGLADMRRGQSPTVTLGPYKGQELSVDHIIPKSLDPSLDRLIANLELLPLRLNQRKSDAVGDRQVSLAKKLSAAGLLSREVLPRVEKAARRSKGR